jgi:hypothetical protein
MFATTDIDGIKYELRPMDPLLVLEHGSKLTAVLVAPALEKAASAGKVEVSKAALLGLGVTVAGEAMKNLAHPDVQAAIRALFAYGSANGVELGQAWKAHFLGKTKAMMTFIMWSMEVQFKDFFSGLTGQIVARLQSVGGLPGSTEVPAP